MFWGLGPEREWPLWRLRGLCHVTNRNWCDCLSEVDRQHDGDLGLDSVPCLGGTLACEHLAQTV